MHIIYKITNLVNHKVYIGVTNNYPVRVNGHLRSAFSYGDPKPLYKAMRKYGRDNFSFEILTETDDRSIEIQFISEYKANNPEYGYNLTDGGEGTVGFVPSEETRAKQRQAKLGRALSEEHKANISKSNMGRILSVESREKIGQKLKGNKHFQGKTFSDETKAVLSAQKSKTWQILDPSGNQLTITNMRQFCIEHGLANSAMSRVLSGQQAHHKGYRAA